MSYHKEIKRQEGTAMSPTYQARVLDHSEIQAAMIRARAMRAEQAGVIAREVAALVKSGFNALFGGLIERRRQNRAIAFLNGMSDRDLRDIGLSRAEIALAVKHGLSADSRRRAPVAITERFDDIAVEAAVRHAA